MFKSKRIIMLIAIIAILIASLASTVIAADYDTGALYNTRFVAMDAANSNSFSHASWKTLSGVNWKIRANSVYSMEGYGIKIYPQCDTDASKFGGSVWVKYQTGYRYGSCGAMDTSYSYELRCRIDDDYTDWMRAIGNWNAN